MARAFAAFSTIPYRRKVLTTRRDTRFYFGEQDVRIKQSFGKCVGVFYLQNPGTAHLLTPKQKAKHGIIQEWGPLCYEKENLLPQIESILDEARKQKDQKRHPGIGDQLHKAAYVQISNLSYIKMPNDKKGEAISIWQELHEKSKAHDDRPFLGHAEDVRFVVFGWGNKFNVSDSERVANSLQPFVTSRTVLFWPTRERIDSVQNDKII